MLVVVSGVVGLLRIVESCPLDAAIPSVAVDADGWRSIDQVAALGKADFRRVRFKVIAVVRSWTT